MKTFFSRPICLAGLVILTLLKTFVAQAQVTTDLGVHQPSTAAPAGNSFEWHNAIPVNNVNLMSAAQIAAASPGNYYGVYHFTSEDCYSSVQPLTVVASQCPEGTAGLTQIM